MNTLHKKQKQPVRSRRHQLGIAAVEFTIALPLLLFLLFVAGEMGRFLYQYNTLTKSAEDGARFMGRSLIAAYSTGTVSDVEADARSLIRYGTTDLTATPTPLPLLPGLDASTITILGNPATNPSEVVVTVTYTYDPVIFPDTVELILWHGIQLAIPLTATVTMPVI